MSERIIPIPAVHTARGPDVELSYTTLDGITHVIPASVGRPIVITKTARGIDAIQAEAESQGADVIHLSADVLPRYYSGSFWGKPRKMSNGDMVSGRAPYFNSTDEFHHAYVMCDVVADAIRAELDKMHPLLRQAELDNLDKLTVQQGHAPGYYIETLIDPRAPNEMPPLYSDTIQFVCKVVARLAGETINYDLLTALKYDTSPVDTNQGVPTATSRELGREMRISTARSLPRFTPGDMGRFIDGLEPYALQLGLPEYGAYGCLIARRTGPTKKPATLYERTGNGFMAHWDATGLHCRSRLVYMVPAHLNALLSPLVIAIKAAFRRIVGLNHEPEWEDKAIAQMRENGGTPYEADFSSMDRTFGPAARREICIALRQAGFNEDSIDLIEFLEDNQPVMYPGWLESGLTVLRGPHGLYSGFLHTSVFDSLHNLACTLSALREQLGDEVLTLWENQTLGLRVLGDDTALALPKKYDSKFRPDKMTENMLEYGGVAKWMEGLVFLQRVQPLGPFVKNKAAHNLMSRVLQNTWFNEQPAEIKPIARLGYAARTATMSHHPHWAAIEPTFVAAAKSSLRFAKDGLLPQEGDAEAIVQFSIEKKGFAAELRDALSYRPTVAETYRILRAMGIDLDSLMESDFAVSSHIKEQVGRGLLSDPDPKAIADVHHATWLREAPEGDE